MPNRTAYSVLIYPLAEKDIREITEYLQELSDAAATNFIDALSKALEPLEHFPEMHPFVTDKRLSDKGYRFCVVGDYLVFYTINDDIVQIRRIVYGKRSYLKFL